MRAVKILILGSSVTLNVRPPRAARDEGNYSELLERQYEFLGVRVFNHGKWNEMVYSISLTDFANLVMGLAPDVVIFNYGVNECMPRLLPHWLWRLLNRHDSKRRPLLYYINRLLVWIAPHSIRLFRRKGWVTPDQYREALTKRIDIVHKETQANVLVLNIGPTSDRVESLLPGANAAIRRFNEVLTQVASDCNGTLIDVYGLVSARGVDSIQPDGIHFNAEGHRLVATLIARALNLEPASDTRVSGSRG